MKLAEFDFDLPTKLIAVRPAKPRSSAKLLLACGSRISDRNVSDLPMILKAGDRLVLNDTKVIPARLNGERLRVSGQGETRAKVEVTLLTCLPDANWRVLAKPLKRLKCGETIEFSADLKATVVLIENGEAVLEFNSHGNSFDNALAAVGQMPLPPYIAALRPVDGRDNADYQTVFARAKGAVAAPTASLHFDQDLLDKLISMGVEVTYVTLHVGAGTFLPVKVDTIAEHKMHSEWGEMSDTAAAEINNTRANGGRIIPVGTTALRLIESAAGEDGSVRPWNGATDIFITPGYKFRVASGLMTNFHLPKSTLMMLVSALMGMDGIRRIYQHAIRGNYRFFSYGDSSLLLPENENDSDWSL